MVQFGLILDIIYKFMWYFRDGGAILEKIDLKNGGILYYGTYKMS